MRGKKVLGAIGIGLLMIAIGAAAAVVLHIYEQRHAQATKPAAKTANATKPATTASNLNVSSGSSIPLGGSGGSQSSAVAGANTKSAANNSVNPANFKEFDKYQSATNALFAELEPGVGAELVANKKAAVYYKVWLTNGQLVDQTRADAKGQQQPFLFTLGAKEVVPGLEQGMAGMKAGGKRLIIVPPSSGYGTQGKDPVPPNAVMIFEVQLLTVQ